MVDGQNQAGVLGLRLVHIIIYLLIIMWKKEKTHFFLFFVLSLHRFFLCNVKKSVMS
jgi:hypothetical protein